MRTDEDFSRGLEDMDMLEKCLERDFVPVARRAGLMEGERGFISTG